MNLPAAWHSILWTAKRPAFRRAIYGAALTALGLLGILFQAHLSWFYAIQFLFWSYLIILIGAALALVSIVAPKVRAAMVGAGFVFLLAFILPFGRDLIENVHFGDSPPQTHLKVIAFNWMADNPHVLQIYPWLKAQSADIVAIEEFTPGAQGVETQLYPQFPFRTSGGGDILILSKYPIQKEMDVPAEEHTAVITEIGVNGHTVQVVAVHAPTLRNIQELAMRNAYLSKLAYFLPWWKDSRLVIGDFNATRWDPYFARAEKNARAHEQPALFPWVTRMGVRSGLSFLGSPIDHILIDRKGSLSKCHTGPAFGSDHAPIICEATFFGKAPKPH